MAIKAQPQVSESGHQDANQNYSIIGVQGTLGTADIQGTAPTVSFSADPVTGAQYVYNLGPAGSVSLGNTPGGTLNFIGSIATIGTLPSITTSVSPNLPVIAGTPADPGTPLVVRLTDGTNYYNASGGAGAGTNVNIITGTIQSSGTTTGVGTITNLGSFTNGGTIKEISNIAGGTITTALNSGTITTIAAGTLNTLGTVGSVTNLGSVTNIGTVKEVTLVPTVSNLSAGSIAVITGTIGGKAASGAASVANPVLIAGTDAGGTVYAPLISSAGAVSVTGASAGTFNNISTGTQQTLGTVGVVNNIVTGTLATVGTIPGLGTLSNLGSFTNGGTIKEITNIAGGTITTTLNSGTITTIAAGTQNTLGTIGTVLGIGGTLQTSGPISIISTNNSTTGTLAANGTYTGVFEDVTSYSEMRVSVWASTPSASDGLTFQQSPDGTNIDVTDVYNIVATTGKTFVVPRQAKFYRINYVNGGTTQTGFRLQTILNRTATSASSQRTSDTYTNETDMEQVWSFNSLWNGANWDRVKGTAGTAFVTIPAGTLQTLGTIGVVQNAGTIQGGTINNLATGTINALAAGTITGGTLQNLVSGTINALASGTITAGTVSVTTGTVVLNTGTITTIAAGTQNTLGTVGVVNNLVTGTIAAVTAVTTVSNLTNGSINLLTGTVTSVTNLAGGTVQSNQIPTVTQLTFGTTGTTGAVKVGTLVGGTGSGAGTEFFVTSLSLSIPSNGGSQDVSIGFGTASGTFHAGTGRLLRGFFPPGGGIQKTFSPALNSGTNAQIGFFQGGAGTAHIDISYFTAPSTI